MYGMQERERGKRSDIYNTIIMEQETDGGELFLISRVHDMLLLMSDDEQKKRKN